MSRPRIRWESLARAGAAALALAGLLALLPRLLEPGPPAVPPADVGLAGVEPAAEPETPRASGRGRANRVRAGRHGATPKHEPAAHRQVPNHEHRHHHGAGNPGAVPASARAPVPEPPVALPSVAPSPPSPMAVPTAPTKSPAAPPPPSPQPPDDGHADGGNRPPEFGFEH